eukprot:sb/3465674/
MSEDQDHITLPTSPAPYRRPIHSTLSSSMDEGEEEGGDEVVLLGEGTEVTRGDEVVLLGDGIRTLSLEEVLDEVTVPPLPEVDPPRSTVANPPRSTVTDPPQCELDDSEGLPHSDEVCCTGVCTLPVLDVSDVPDVQQHSDDILADFQGGNWETQVAVLEIGEVTGREVEDAGTPLIPHDNDDDIPLTPISSSSEDYDTSSSSFTSSSSPGDGSSAEDGGAASGEGSPPEGLKLKPRKITLSFGLKDSSEDGSIIDSDVEGIPRKRRIQRHPRDVVVGESSLTETSVCEVSSEESLAAFSEVDTSNVSDLTLSQLSTSSSDPVSSADVETGGIRDSRRRREGPGLAAGFVNLLGLGRFWLAPSNNDRVCETRVIYIRKLR